LNVQIPRLKHQMPLELDPLLWKSGKLWDFNEPKCSNHTKKIPFVISKTNKSEKNMACHPHTEY